MTENLPQKPWKPNAAQLAAARDLKLRDCIAVGLRCLFVGINPSLYSAAVGHHFARPGNRFWPAIFRGGLTPRLLSPFEDRQLVQFGLGLTNLVARATARADELSDEELRLGADRLRQKARKYRPQCVAFLGISAYRTAYQRPRATVGRQEEWLAESLVWVLPNPSGLNAHFQLDDFARCFDELRRELPPPPPKTRTK